MRLFLLPISRSRTLLYCDKIYPKLRALPAASSSAPPQAGSPPSTTAPSPASTTTPSQSPEQQTADQAPKPISSLREVFFPPTPPNGTPAPETTILDRATDFAASTWTSWEREDKGWQKRITVLGNTLLRRIPYEEWALKSVAPLNKRRRADYDKIAGGGQDEEVQRLREKRTVKVLFPPWDSKGSEVTGVEEGDVVGEVMKLARERRELHRRKMILSLIGAPLTLPFALVPVVPNIPGFYMLFRAWSHWRAWSGATHLELLVQNNLLRPTPDRQLSKIYEMTIEKRRQKLLEGKKEEQPGDVKPPSDTLVLDQEAGKEMAAEFGVPELQVEVERAVEQIGTALQKGLKEKEKTA